MARLKSFGLKIRGLAFILAVVSATVFVVYYFASAANTTIGNNISTSGTLTVGGLAKFSSQINASSTILVDGLASLTGFISSASSTVSARLQVNGGVFASSTLQVTGDTRLYGALIVDGSFGLGTTTSSQLLSVQGNALISGNITSVANITATGTITISGTASSSIATALGVASTSPWGTFSVEMGTVNPSLVISNNGSSTPSLFVAGVNQNGYVGIGTQNPTEALTVNGNISNIATSTNTVNPVLRGSAGITGTNFQGSYVFVSGRYAYVTNEYVAGTSGNFQIFDVSTSSPALVSSLSLSSYRLGVVKVAGQYAYVQVIDSLPTNTQGGLMIFDISNPSAPNQVSFVPLNGNGYGYVDVKGNRAYVVNSNTLKNPSFQIFDISNPLNPVKVSITKGLVGPVFVNVSGKYAYVSDQSTGDVLKIYNISTSTPALVGSISTGNDPAEIYVSGKYLYLGSYVSNTFEIYDISNPASPVQLSTTSTGASTGPWGLYVSGRFAYLTLYDSGQLKIFDVANPLSPVAVGTVTTSPKPTSVHVSGRYAYVVGQNGATDKLEVFDIGGLETTSANIHSLEAGNLQVRNDILAQGYLTAGSITVGIGGALSNGPLTVTATASPSSFLGDLIIGTSTPATTSPNFGQFSQSTVVIEATSSGSVPLTVRGSGSQLANLFQIQSSDNVNLLVLSNSGRLGIGTSTPGVLFAVHGNALFAGPTTTVANLIATGTLTVNSTTATSTFANGIKLTGGCVQLVDNTCAGSGITIGGAISGGTANRVLYENSSNALAESANLTFDGTTLVAVRASTTGMLTIGTGFIASASSTIANLLNVQGPISASSTLIVNGVSTFTGLSNLTGGFISSGSSSISSLLNVQGPISASSTLIVNGQANFSGSVGIGTSTPARLLSVQGNALLSGDLQLANLQATGTLGISSSTPYARLAIKANVRDATRLVSVASSSDDVYFEISSTGTTTINQLQTGIMTFDTNAGSVTWIDMPVTSDAAAGTVMSYQAMIDASSTLTVYAESDGNGGIKNQRVGIATSTPAFTLSVVGNVGLYGCMNSATTTVDLGSDSCLDIAEIYTAGEDLAPGDLVALDLNNPIALVKATSSQFLIGAVSTNPAMLFEGNQMLFGGGGILSSAYPKDSKMPLALTGRIPVKVNLEGGEIKIGDPITLSSVPGIGKKATAASRIIGYALENYNGPTPRNNGEVLVFTNLSFWSPPEESSSLLASVIDAVKQWLESLGVFIENGLVTLKDLVAEKITAKKLCAEDTCIDKTQLQAILNSAGNPAPAAGNNSTTTTP